MRVRRISESFSEISKGARSDSTEGIDSLAEGAPGTLRHFVRPDRRPDLHAGSLKAEPDLSL